MRVIALAAVLLLLAVSAGWGGLADGSSSAKLDGGHGDVDAISCAAAGECTAGGYYNDGRSHLQAFVVSMVNGSWGTVTKVPGLASLGRGGGDASVDTISCAAVGECAAGGSYSTSSDRSQAYVESETNGSWGKAIEVPGTAKLNAGGEAYVVSISCGAPGECAAGGVYYDRHDQDRAFVVSETGGVWGKAIEVPGTAKRNSAGVNAISCVAAGECTAAGEYQDGFDSTGGLRLEAFVVTETNGSWGNAIEVPGTASLNTSHNASASSISCVTAGNCAAGGSYVDGKHREQAFVASETNGSWGDAIEVPGTTTLNSNGEAELNSISCAAPGECSAGGYYSGTGGQQAFVLSETNGSWGTAIKVPGAAALNDGGWASVDSISCAAVGECAAGGTYVDGDANLQVFVVDETNGSWASAIEVPGTAKLNTGGDAQVYEVSCGAARDCAAGGFYNPAGRSRPVDRAFVANETNGIWGKAAILKGVPAVCVVPDVLGKALHVATKRIHAAGCRVGTFTYVYSKLKKGRVVSQRPRCDKVVVVRTGIALAVSKGRRAQASLPGARRDAPPFPSC